MPHDLSPVLAFGKIIFIPTHESVPPLPEMNLLFFKEDNREEIFPWRAACIDLEMDACGNSKEEAWENLKHSLAMYIDMEIKTAGSIIGAARNIIQTAFTESEQKKEYVDIYRQAKLAYTMSNLTSMMDSNPIKEEKQRLKKLEAGKDKILFFDNELKAA